MTLRNIIAAIATGLVISFAVTATSAGTDEKATNKQGKRTATLKQGEDEQGTFAYRFDTYTNYSSCSTATCSSTMNSSLTGGSSAYVPPSGQIMERKATKPSKPVEVKKEETPTND